MSAFGSMFGNKGEKVANQVDAEAKTGLRTLENGAMALNQFDLVENNLNTLAQMAQAEGNTLLMGQFDTISKMIDGIQKQVKLTFGQAADSFRTIDQMTDKIQN